MGTTGVVGPGPGALGHLDAVPDDRRRRPACQDAGPASPATRARPGERPGFSLAAGPRRGRSAAADLAGGSPRAHPATTSRPRVRGGRPRSRRDLRDGPPVGVLLFALRGGGRAPCRAGVHSPASRSLFSVPGSPAGPREGNRHGRHRSVVLCGTGRQHVAAIFDQRDELNGIREIVFERLANVFRSIATHKYDVQLWKLLLQFK